MTPEQQMWDTLRQPLVTMGLDPVRVENSLGSGTPDVNYTHGWIELKHLEEWPVRADTIVRLPKLEERPAQVVFLTRRWRSGGLAFLLLRVGRDLVLFDGPTSAQVRAGLTQSAMRDAALWSAVRARADLTCGSPLWAFLVGDMDRMKPWDRARWARALCCHTRDRVAREMGCTVLEVLAGERPGAPRLTANLIEHWEG